MLYSIFLMKFFSKKALEIKKSTYICNRFQTESVIEIARVAQLVEHDLAKVGVAGSNPVSRSKK